MFQIDAKLEIILQTIFWTQDRQINDPKQWSHGVVSCVIDLRAFRISAKGQTFCSINLTATIKITQSLLVRWELSYLFCVLMIILYIHYHLFHHVRDHYELKQLVGALYPHRREWVRIPFRPELSGVSFFFFFFTNRLSLYIQLRG